MRLSLRKILFFCFTALLPLSLKSQSVDFGAILGAEFSGDIVKGLDYGFGVELRTDDCFVHYNQMRLSAGIDYSFLKKRLKLAASFDYSLKNKESFLQNRYRLNGMLTYTEKIRSFKLSLRFRYQTTFLDDSRCYEKFNPKSYFRNRLGVEYSMFSKPLKFYATVEYFVRLYKCDSRIIDNIRTVLGVNYRIDKKNSLDFYLRADNEVQVKAPANIFYLGVRYNF
ncbi:MAG: DUF2490 domain-containing protein [Bacteroidales bacterium]|nr:DUF2490 domain-containing protein [Bacteroidales bacterium]